MKKNLFLLLFGLSITSFAAAQRFDLITTNVDAGYMYHTVETAYDYNSIDTDLKDELMLLFPNNIGNLSLKGTEKYNAFTIGLTMQLLGMAYFGIDLGIPTKMETKGFDPSASLYERTLDVHNSNSIKAVIVNARLGVGYPLDIGGFTLFGGLHAVANYIDVKSEINNPLLLSKTAISNIVDSRKTAILGAGFTVRGTYMFYRIVGITASLDYSCLFWHVFNIRKMEGNEQKTGANIEYTIMNTREKTKPKSQLGHNFAIKIGLTISL